MGTANEQKTNWGQIAASTAGSAIPAILGMVFGKSVDRRQMRQQEKLQNLQIKGEKELMDYSMQKEYDMWKGTGPVGQMEQMKEAGLNPAMMYGGGGAGGATIGSPHGGVGGANAPKGSGTEMMDAMGMGIQMQMQQAQIRLMEAQTKKTNVEADVTGGVGKEKIATEIESLTQGIQNQKAVEALNKAQTRMVGLSNELAGRTMEDRIEMVNYETKRACQEAQQAVNNTDVSDATIKDRINIIKREAVGLLLKNSLTEAQTGKIAVDNRVSEAQISAITTGIEQGWDRINIDKNRIEVDRRLREAGVELQDRGQIINAIIGIMGIGRGMGTVTTESYENKDGIETYRSSQTHRN